METVKKIIKTIAKYAVYCFVFMVNPKSVIFREVDDEADLANDEKSKT